MLDRHAADAVVDRLAARDPRARPVEIAAERGIDALCQKPLTPTLAEGVALAARVAGNITPDGARELALPAVVPDARAGGSRPAISVPCTARP